MMKSKLCILILALAITVTNSSAVKAVGLEDYLILNDIGEYKRKVKTLDINGAEKPIPGYWTFGGSGALKGIGHFTLDHDDTTHETVYLNSTDKVYPKVQVTQHAGGESDRWLLHELEGIHRFDDDNKGLVGMLEWGTVMRKANGQRVMNIDGEFRWISGSKLISITYKGGESEPEEVFLAYLAKHPSTMTMTDSEMKSVEHTRLWLKDEVERRLWLCDKWLEAFAAGKVEVKDLQYELNDNVKVVLLITGKYYDKSVSGDLERLEQYYYFARDTEGMKKMLAELKAWWASHKGDTPDVPTYEEVKNRQRELFK